MRLVVKDIPGIPGVNPNFSQGRAFSNGSLFHIAGSVEMTSGLRAPYVAGDRLYVKEAWVPGYDHAPDSEKPMVTVIFKADNEERMVAAPSCELADEWDARYSEDGDRPPRPRSAASMPKWPPASGLR
ncbi:hypothetical protein [Luteibacter sahnii]|uniref:hypothetical protein n=1 Tax=Luteibacter sahnii TaxID=3021977 RepID=UPI002A69DD8A|nr:hypothetical protein [Luteibacter sp. PPL193]MDY1547865.1 hypothetical protein [Luteibacter sp. PPL193]